MATFNIYEKITEKIINALDKNEIPWQKPWVGSAMAISHTNGRPYSLLNQFLLENKSGEWLTFNQIKSENGRIIKGEKSHFVVFWKFIPKVEKDENGNDVVVGEFPILRYYDVWHISQVEGISPKYEKETAFNHSRYDEAEKIISDYVKREDIKLFADKECDKAFYTPKTDSVTLPIISQFEFAEQYYSTAFHELTHSTGAEKRLNRDGIVKFDIFGSQQYSKEELIAEIGAAFLVNSVGLDTQRSFNNSVAYIQSWRKVLSNDPKLIVTAANKAEQAAKFILTGEKPKAE